MDEDSKRLSILRASNIYVYDKQGVVGYGAHNGSEITALFVLPEFRGQSVGIALLEYLLSKAPPQVYLYVAKLNTLAIHLFQKYGFEIVIEFQADYNGVLVLANKMIRKSPADSTCLTPSGENNEY